MPPKTFADLHIPFPLFEAPTSEASGYVGLQKCAFCNHENLPCFQLGIGTALLLPCPNCSSQNALDADDRTPLPCRKCQHLIPFPKVPADILICYSCLRSGAAAITKDTELGMISAQDLLTPTSETTTNDTHDILSLPLPTKAELLRTPTYLTIQGDQWLFCCNAPMIYLGEWSRENFTHNAPNHDGRSLFEKVVIDPIPGLWEDSLHDTTAIYVFRCPHCSQLRAHWDIA